ncbi:MAG: MoxR family ATPase [Cellulosilyticum sp.]|nr:MoxR family ATPase [Cellulosilyticum sp.]
MTEKQAMTLDEVMVKLQGCKEEIAKGIIGQQSIVEEVLICIFSGGNVLLEGMPGLGKTQLVKTMSKVLDLEFNRIQFTPDLMPADVVGTNLVVKEQGSTVFQFERGPVFTHLLLADEINRATPKTQAALLEAMGEKTVTVGGKTYHLEEPFIVMATQNPIEQEGTYPLPEAQLDRFMFKLKVDFPSLDELSQIMDLTVNSQKQEIKALLKGSEIMEMRCLISEIPMTDAVKQYALKLIVGTHPEVEGASEMIKRYVTVGASPRAAQALLSAAKVRALLMGRYNVSFEDIKALAYPVLRHRLYLSFEALTDRMTPEAIIEQLIQEIKVV